MNRTSLTKENFTHKSITLKIKSMYIKLIRKVAQMLKKIIILRSLRIIFKNIVFSKSYKFNKIRNLM